MHVFIICHPCIINFPPPPPQGWPAHCREEGYRSSSLVAGVEPRPSPTGSWWLPGLSPASALHPLSEYWTHLVCVEEEKGGKRVN